MAWRKQQLGPHGEKYEQMADEIIECFKKCPASGFIEILIQTVPPYC